MPFCTIPFTNYQTLNFFDKFACIHIKNKNVSSKTNLFTHRAGFNRGNC